MPTLMSIKLLVKEIGSLSNSLSDAMPKGSKDDKIWSVMKAKERDTPHETFNWQFDVLFAEDCHDSDGCLCHVHQGKLGMGLIMLYLSKINWTGFPLDLVELKLQCLVTELKHLQRADVPQPVCSFNLTAKLKDTDNISAPELSFQRKAVKDFHSCQAQVSSPAKNDHPRALSMPDSCPHLVLSTSTVSTPQNKHGISSVAGDDSDAGGNQPTQSKKKCITASSSQSIMINDLDPEDTDDDIHANGENKCATLGNPVAVDTDGLLIDVDVQLIDDNLPTCEEKWQDVNHFFCAAAVKDVNGKSKKYRACKLCLNNKSLVDEVTTLRRHLEANHFRKYHAWAKSANFMSKLLGDIKKHKKAAQEVNRTLDRDLQEKVTLEQVVPYSDKLFCQVAIEWVAATDQPIQALEHPKFKELIGVASRVKNGVNIPGRKATR